ncbi:MAG: SDR family oxidoreductase [Novosphingobium sp.]|nr:SDR family oxidoreductase [Novosphingobium sp.]
MDLGVRGKVFALVGGTGGIGFDTARLLAAEGANLALFGRGRERGETRAQALAQEFGADVRMYVADASISGQVEAAIEQAAADFGQLNGMANTSGLMQTRKTLLDVSDEVWEQYFQDHLMSTVRAARAAVPHLIAAGGGTIVNTAALSIHAMKPPLMGYATMKNAVVSLTKNIALTYGEQGVRANTVAPGFIAGESVDGIAKLAMKKYGLPRFEAITKAMREDYHLNVALGRPGRPEEIADLYAFLLSERGGYMTGALINSDGGTQF